MNTRMLVIFSLFISLFGYAGGGDDPGPRPVEPRPAPEIQRPQFDLIPLAIPVVKQCVDPRTGCLVTQMCIDPRTGCAVPVVEYFYVLLRLPVEHPEPMDMLEYEYLGRADLHRLGAPVMSEDQIRRSFHRHFSQRPARRTQRPHYHTEEHGGYREGVSEPRYRSEKEIFEPRRRNYPEK